MNDTIKKSERVVAGAVAAATLTGGMPIPFADAPLLIGEQIAMMAAISKIFKLDIKEDGLKALAAAAIGVGGATLIGRTLVSGVLKIIPGAGWFIGGAISAATAGTITYAMGKAFIELCKAIQVGKLDEGDLATEKGLNFFVNFFKDIIKDRKKGDSIFSSDEEDEEDDDYTEVDDILDIL